MGRRTFWVFCLIPILILLPLLTGASARNSYAAGKYALELDGRVVGWLHSAEGGQAVADVVTEEFGDDWLQKKHIGNVKYEEITVTVADGMSRELFQWVRDFTQNKAGRKNGAIIAADYTYSEISRLEFHNAVITELGLPALDAASKDAAKMTIKFAPEYTRMNAGSGKKLAIDAKGQKKWLPANFRLRIDGLEEASSRVSKIEAFTIKQKVAANAAGELRDYEKEPAKVEIPNLVITFPESYAKPLYDWHEDFVIRGNNSEEQEKGGTLEYLAPNMTDVLYTITFKHLGIFKLTPDKMEAGTEQIRRVKAEMYCEEMTFVFTTPN